MPHNSPTGWVILLDLLLGGAAGLAGGFVRWNHPERRRLGWCLVWEVPSAALVGSAGYALGGLLEFNEYGRFLFAFVFGYPSGSAGPTVWAMRQHSMAIAASPR